MKPLRASASATPEQDSRAKSSLSVVSPCPTKTFCQKTIEEQIICYADKFYSKSHLERERSIAQTIASLEKFGDAGVEKFRCWTELFE